MRVRIILGSLIVLALAGLLWLDFHVAGAGTVLATALLASGAVYELFAMMRASGQQAYGVTGLLLAAMLPLCFGLCGWQHCAVSALYVAPVVAVIVICIGRACAARNGLEGELTRVIATVFGVLYIALPMAMLVRIRFLTDGWGLLLITLATTKVSDIGAYFTGRFLGRRKLAPRISPNKTVEGALGGLAASILVSWVLADLSGLGGPLLSGTWRALGFGAAVGLGSQLGDLTESFIKRAVAVKDSGSLLPAFGGLLDLIDSFLVAAPVACTVLAVFQG
jgi:phosphatidate cytidylyltransferase